MLLLINMIIIYLKIISQILGLFIEIIIPRIEKKNYSRYQKHVKKRDINYMSQIVLN